MTDYQSLLENIYNLHKDNQEGHLASYIPELAKVDPKLFALSITTIDGKNYFVGNADKLFTLQSTSKPFCYGLALMEHGADYVHDRVGHEPTGEAFNSIIELEKSTHRPFNPMINSGAIAIANMLTKKNEVLNLFSKISNRTLAVNEEVFLSEKNTAHRNRAIANLLRHFEVIGDNIEETLDLYFRQCSIEVNVKDLSMMAATLSNRGTQPITKEKIYSDQFTTDMVGLIFTCGMYDTAGTWAYQVGVPAKSGVSGAIFSVVPGKFGIAAYSPLIDDHGHSVRGSNAIKDIMKKLGINIFN